MPLLLEWRKEKHFSCVCVVETVSLLVLLLLLLSLFLCSFLLPSDYNFFGLLLVQWERPPRVPIVGVPATSGGRCVLEEAEWRVIAVLLLKMYVRMACESRWRGADVDAHEGRYFVW